MQAHSIMVLVPSTKLASILGFMCLAAASSATESGVSWGRRGLFLPLPAQTTSKPRSVTKSNSSLTSTGSSPLQTA